ncbi:MAG: uroporphyrinogen-III C-methyltransferase [Gammaproteobacteria bacterium]
MAQEPSHKAAEKQSPQQQPTAAQSSKISLVALALSLTAVLLTLWTAAQQLKLQQLPDEISSTQNLNQEVSRNMQALEASNLSIDELLKALQSDLSGQSETLTTQAEKLVVLESKLNRLSGTTEEARSAWLLSEAKYYLQLANAQAQLASNASVAVKALELADAKLALLSDPGLVSVRARISDDVAALKSIEESDRTGVVLKLDSLTRQVSSMPYRQPAPEQFRPDADASDAEIAMDRAMDTLRSAFSSLVDVKRRDEPVVTQLTEEGEALLQNGLQLELQIAKIASLRNNQELYEVALTQARQRIENYFDTDSKAVQSALETIDSLMDINFPEALPDISGALVMLEERGGA